MTTHFLPFGSFGDTVLYPLKMSRIFMTPDKKQHLGIYIFLQRIAKTAMRARATSPDVDAMKTMATGLKPLS